MEQGCLLHAAESLFRFRGFTLKCRQENNEIQQKDYEKDIINSVLLVDGNNRAGNIFACNNHIQLLFQDVCHDQQSKIRLQ
jgi:hypothetical protein